MNRREFFVTAAALGATAMLGCSRPRASRTNWRERRDFFPEGVASGEPGSDSVLLWTRYPGGPGRDRIVAELAEDPTFQEVVASSPVTVSANDDWTCRVLVGDLKPRTIYWYRFTDSSGNGSRVGRTITAPTEDDDRPQRFAFVSCQNANQGAQNAYRRMMYEDLRLPAEERLAFVLHLGDFIYEMVWYPEDRPQGMYDRRLRDIVRYPHGEKIADFHIPTTVDDYRAVYRAYLHDPDIQDARAHWPFVNMWDNHEFSWLGWQGFQRFNGENRPAQTRKVAANQAWFEYQPARVSRAGVPLVDSFNPPKVADAPIGDFDDQGLSQDQNNLDAIASLTGYRSLRWGKHIELLITDQHSYRSEDPLDRPEAKAFSSPDFPQLVPQEAQEILDAGRDQDDGAPPGAIRYGKTYVPNFRRGESPQTILGADQKVWFLGRLRSSDATWKIWGNTLGTLDWRADPQNLPAGLTHPWPGAGYAGFGGGDYGAAYRERSEIYDIVKDERITGFVTVSGDRHSFWAGLAAKALPPHPFDPIGVAFVTGSISAPGLVEAMEHNLADNHPLRSLFLARPPGADKPEPSVNLLMRYGVRSALEYQRTGDVERARQASNPSLSPHLSFLDMGGHGYATVRVAADAIACEFVCIPRPLERAKTPDGGPLLYRVVHRVKMWTAGEAPRLEQHVLEGNPILSL